MNKATSIGLRAALAVIVAGTLATSAFAQNDSSNQQETGMKVRIEFNSVSMTAVLYDNPSARDFASMLPLDLELDNYGNNEKIAYLPRKLTEEGSGPVTGEAPGDLAYYAPWGNIILYYADWSYTNGLIRLGHIEGGIDPLLVPGRAAAHIELAQ